MKTLENVFLETETKHSERNEKIDANHQSRITLKKSLPLFANALSARKLAPSSISAYVADLSLFDNFIAEYTSKAYVKDINRVDITNYQNHLLKSVYKKNTVDRKFDALKVYFRFLFDNAFIPNDLLKNFVFKRSKNAFSKDEDNTINYLEMDLVEEIVDYARFIKGNVHKYRDIAILELLKTTGCRRDTVLTIDWSDVNFSKGEITLKHLKTNSVGKVKMAPGLKDALMDHYNATINPSSCVFRSQKGGNLSKDALAGVIDKYAVLSGVQRQVDFKITTQTFRHSFITFCVVNNVPLAKIALITGHKDLDTLKYYTHLVSKDTECVANLFS